VCGTCCNLESCQTQKWVTGRDRSLPPLEFIAHMTDDEKRYEELKAKLMPPAPELDEKDITIAHARYAMNSLIWDYMYDMVIYLKWLENPENDEVRGWIKIRDDNKIKDDAIQSANILWKKIHDLDDDKHEDWDRIEPKFREHILGSLSDMHGGDCTAVACSCMRCHAEETFKVPYTANWSKGEGYKMEQEFLNLKKKLGK
jgi:hypothetical protein